MVGVISKAVVATFFCVAMSISTSKADGEMNVTEFSKQALTDNSFQTYLAISGGTLAYAQMAMLDKMKQVLYCPPDEKFNMNGAEYAQVLNAFVAKREDIGALSVQKFELALLLSLQDAFPCAQ